MHFILDDNIYREQNFLPLHPIFLPQATSRYSLETNLFCCFVAPTKTNAKTFPIKLFHVYTNANSQLVNDSFFYFFSRFMPQHNSQVFTQMFSLPLPFNLRILIIVSIVDIKLKSFDSHHMQQTHLDINFLSELRQQIKPKFSLNYSIENRQHQFCRLTTQIFCFISGNKKCLDVNISTNCGLIN